MGYTLCSKAVASLRCFLFLKDYSDALLPNWTFVFCCTIVQTLHSDTMTDRFSLSKTHLDMVIFQLQ